jgi:hypothetical protein
MACANVWLRLMVVCFTSTGSLAEVVSTEAATRADTSHCSRSLRLLHSVQDSRKTCRWKSTKMPSHARSRTAGARSVAAEMIAHNVKSSPPDLVSSTATTAIRITIVDLARTIKTADTALAVATETLVVRGMARREGMAVGRVGGREASPTAFQILIWDY